MNFMTPNIIDQIVIPANTIQNKTKHQYFMLLFTIECISLSKIVFVDNTLDIHISMAMTNIILVKLSSPQLTNFSL